MNADAKQRRKEARKMRRREAAGGGGGATIDLLRGKCKKCRAPCRADRGDVCDQYGIWMCAACYAQIKRRYRKLAEGGVNMDIVRGRVRQALDGR